MSIFTGGTPRQVFYSGGANGVVAAGATSWLNIVDLGLIPTGTGRNTIIPVPGIVRNFYFVTGIAQPASGNLVVDVLQNNAVSGMGIIVPAGAAGATWTDLTTVLTITPGDTLTIRLVNNAAANSTTIQNASMEFVFS